MGEAGVTEGQADWGYPEAIIGDCWNPCGFDNLELEGEVDEVVRVLRRIGGGDNAGGEVRDGPRPARTEERTAAAVDTVPEPGTTATSATLLPGRWTQELAADFTAGLDIVARRVLFQVWRAGAAGIHRNTLCQRTDLEPVELRSLVMRMGRVLRRFQRDRGLALSRPVAANSPLQSYFINADFAAVASDLFGERTVDQLPSGLRRLDDCVS